MCFARGERISRYQFACKGTIFFSFVQINVKKSIIFMPNNIKTFATHLRHVTAFAGAKVLLFSDI